VVGGRNTAQCAATIVINEALRRSLTGPNGGRPIRPEHRCSRDVGHPGAHRALADIARRCWFRWDDWGFRLGVTVDPGPVTGQRSGGRHRSRTSDARGSGASEEAIRALTEAVDRLTATIAASMDPGRGRPFPQS
jgi:hypothetical protein